MYAKTALEFLARAFNLAIVVDWHGRRRELFAASPR